MGANLTTLSSILKTQYLGPIREQVNNDTILLNRLSKNEDSVVGKNFTIPVHIGGNSGVGSAAENGALPVAGSQQYKETIVPMKYLYGTIEISGPAIKAAANNEGAFIRAVESEVKGVTLDLKKKLNQMLWADGTGNTGLDVMGLQGIFSATSVLQGLDPTTYSWWKANILANAGTNRAISEMLLQTACDTTEKNSDGQVTAFYTTYGVRRAYQQLLQSLKQYVNTQEFKGGYKTLAYNDKPFLVDKDAPANKVFCADEDALQIYRLSDFDWMEEDGAILARVSGKDAYGAVLYKYMELGCSARNRQTLLSDITEA